MRIGIALGAHEIRAVVMDKQVIAWHGRAAFRGVDEIGAALTALLGEMPRGRKRAFVSIAPAWVQVRRLRGIPPLKSARLMAETIRQNASAFFLWKGPAAVTIAFDSSGEPPWGAAFDQAVLDETVHALRASRIQHAAAAPAVCVVARAFPNRRLVWRDDADCLTVESKGTALVRAERCVAVDEPFLAPPPTLIARIGEDAACYIDAYAASVAPKRVALSWRPEPDQAGRQFWSKARAASATIAIASALAFALFGSGVRAGRFTSNANAELARYQKAELELSSQEAELRRVTQSLNRIEAFRAQRGHVTKLLGDLSRAIPDSTALITFHVDSVEGGFTAIARSIADVLPLLSDVEGVFTPRIIGSVTRESIGTIRVERASFRFVRSPTRAITAKGATR